MPVYMVAVVSYVAVLLALGLFRTRSVKTGDDFLIAGRTLPARVLVFTLLSTWIGSGSLFGGAGLGYRAGFPALWQSAGAWLGIALVFFLAPRVRRLAQYTVPDLLELRYGAAARVLGTIAIVLAYTTIAAYQFRGGGRVLNLVTGLDPVAGAFLTAVVCITLTAFAGMLSVAYLDVGNGLVMLLGVTLGVVFLLGHGGGVTPSLAALRPDQVSLFGTLGPQAALAVFLPTLFLLMGEASMYQKFFSAKNAGAARRAAAGWIVGTIVVESLIVSVGVFGSAALPGLDRAASEAIVIQVALDVLPTLLGIVLLCGAAAIVISTANSFLLIPSTNLMRDVYQRFLNPRATDRQILVYTRGLVVVLGLAGFAIGNFFPTILAMALWAYTMYGAGVTPALLAAFVWPRATRQGGVASIGTGIVTTIAWEAVAALRGSIREPEHLLGLQTVYPALLLSIAALVVVSLLTAPESAVGSRQ